MPISIDKFKLDEDHNAVLKFLKNNIGQGYTEEEIIVELNDYIFGKVKKTITDYEKPKILELFHLNRILDELVNSGYVKKKEINDKDYFYYE